MSYGEHWDLVLSCFEPVGEVTGGIGTYTRYLLELWRSRPVGERKAKVLFLTSERNREANAKVNWGSITVAYVPAAATIEDAPLNNLGDPYRVFGYGMMMKLRELQGLGHTFGLMEVPDFCAEGYYVLKARSFGLLDIGKVAVRLHSPLLMLHPDNDSRAEADEQIHRFYDEERAVYRGADQVLYGGDAMLDRVVALLPPALGNEVRAKAVKIPHLWPSPLAVPAPPADGNGVRSISPVEVGYVGRLEYRKGVDLLVRAAVRALRGGSRPARFHFFGKDTQTFRGGSALERLEALVPEELRASFVFHGYVPQEQLWREQLPKMDLFVFPSRFENYPNVLLEVIGLGRPVLVSRHGCMPEIGAAFPSVAAFAPEDEAAFAGLLGERISAAPENLAVAPTYLAAAKKIAEEVGTGYSTLIDAARPSPASKPAGAARPGVSIIVAHYNHSRWLPSLLASARPQLANGDELIVVDDCSSPEESAKAKEAVEGAGYRFISTPENSGPAAARNLGARTAKNGLLYFVDADDELVPDTLDLLCGAFARRPELEVVSGYARAFGDDNHGWASYDPTLATILVANSSHCGIVIRRELFGRVGGYQERMRLHIEDWELHMRLVLAGARFEIIPVFTYRYRVDKAAGRNSTNQDRIEHSYESSLREALSSATPEQLVALWPHLSEFLVTLLTRKPPVVQVAPEAMRYQIVDRLNGLFKKTPLHPLLKKAVSSVWR